MAEFPNLGTHCALEGCHCLDFLPFICDSCNRTYCLSHRQPLDHQCETCASVIIHEKTPFITTQSRCSYSDCKNREFVYIVCKHCSTNFCLHHRHQQDHACTALPQMGITESKTSALVKSILESKSSSSRDEKRPRSQSKKSLKMLAQVNLMKMKMNAIGDKGLPLDQRVYLMTTIPSDNDSTLSPRTKAFYFCQTWTVGRVIDHLAVCEKLKNMNNVSAARKLLLFTNDGCQQLAMDISLQELILQNILFNGDTVILRYH